MALEEGARSAATCDLAARPAERFFGAGPVTDFRSDLAYPADSELKPAGIPINYRPPFRFEAGHDSNQLSAVFRL